MKKAKKAAPKRKPARAAKQEPMIVALLLDKTGSMESIKVKTISAVNEYMWALRGQDIKFCLRQFSTGLSIDTCWMAPINEAPSLNDKSYECKGGTPLYDETIAIIERLEREVPNAKKVVIAIQTDGEENSSRRTMRETKAAIERAQDRGWVVSFIGTGIDRWIGQEMGIPISSTLSTKSAGDIGLGMRANASATMSYARGAVSNANFYSEVQASNKVDVGR